MRGVWVPIVTPFRDGAVDHASMARLVERYVPSGLTGLVVLGTTGESPTVTLDEQVELLDRTVEVVAGRLPVIAGVSSNATAHAIEIVERFEPIDLAGYLVVCPYYSRPGQDGLDAHFRAVAQATERPILVYNIPYRTGVNMSNRTLLGLAEVPNIVGVKDSCGDVRQSLELLRDAPEGFSVLTGEDHFFFTSVAAGGAGGILAAAHLATETFVDVYEKLVRDDLDGARKAWHAVAPVVPLLFGEANPMPLKHCLWRVRLIDSPECRLPLTRVSDALAAELDRVVATPPVG